MTKQLNKPLTQKQTLELIQELSKNKYTGGRSTKQREIIKRHKLHRKLLRNENTKQ